jgi:hypothetical protein
MAACTTPDLGTTDRPATGCAAPRVAITRGPSGARRVTSATYRRRRLAVALLALSVTVVAARTGGALGGSPLAAPERRSSSVAGDAEEAIAGPQGPVSAGDVVVVRPGDTLWSIASRIAPADDPRPLVDELARVHGAAPLQPGERIRVPD